MEERLEHLQRIYRHFEDSLQAHALACAEGCAACCTRNVVMTALEGRWILANLDAPARRRLFSRIAAAAELPRFQPDLTVNRMADLLEAGENVPDEESRPEGDPCPLLEKGRCTIYAFRPFMCRSMVSEAVCRDLGHAVVNPLVLTMAHVLMQVIEHLDVRGFTGNLTDVFLALAGDGDLDAAGPDRVPAAAPKTLPNHPLRRLMVPPGHRKKVQAFLSQCLPSA